MKFLITGGCSFSWPSNTWTTHLPHFVSDRYHVNVAMVSQGNALISRKLIHQISKRLLDNDILVGVVWSGPDRHDFYLDKKIKIDNSDSWVENPTGVVKDSPGSWIITNHSWRQEYSKIYYRTFHDSIGQLVYSYEHILRTQWFLEKHNIKYFMGTYTNEVFPNNHIDHPEVKYLYDMIDHSKFLPNSIYEWCRDFSGLEFPIKGDNHPSSEQQKLFTKQVIVPFLKEKNYL